MEKWQFLSKPEIRVSAKEIRVSAKNMARVDTLRFARSPPSLCAINSLRSFLLRIHTHNNKDTRHEKI